MTSLYKMKTSLIYGIIAALIALFFMYLDTRILDNPKTRATYIKNMALVGGIVGGGIYLIGEEGFEQAVGITTGSPFGSGSGFSGGGDSYGYGDNYVSGINEEIMTGKPNF